jgi:hypothetical protein
MNELIWIFFFVDVVFFIFLYQRWIYPIDPTRLNEFGTSQEMLEQNGNAVTDQSESGTAVTDQSESGTAVTDQSESPEAVTDPSKPEEDSSDIPTEKSAEDKKRD